MLLLRGTARIICVIGVFAADVGLIALNLHFLGDVVADSFVGVSTGLLTVAVWRASHIAIDRGNYSSTSDNTSSD
jgi:hypothetical protein